MLTFILWQQIYDKAKRNKSHKWKPFLPLKDLPWVPTSPESSWEFRSNAYRTEPSDSGHKLLID